jgi:sugar phosphate permease
VIVGTLWISHTVYFFNYMMVGALAPLIRGELGLTSADIGLLCSAVTIGSGASQIPSGIISDSFGAKWVMFSGLILIGGATMAVSLATSFWPIFLLLVLVGAGIGANQTPGSKAIIMWFSVKGRATAMGVKQTGVTMGGVLSSFVLPWVALHFGGWRHGFITAGLAAFAAALIVVTLYREPPAQPRESPRQSAHSNSDAVSLLFDRDFLLFSASGVLLMLTQFAFTGHFVLYATSALRLPVDTAGALLGVAFVAGVVGRLFWSASSDYLFKAQRKIVFLLVGIIGAFVLIGFVPLSSDAMAPVYIITALFGLSGLGWNAVYLTRVGEFGGKALAGRATGVNFVIVNIGAMVGPPIFGYIVDATHGYGKAWVFMSLCMAMVAVLTWMQKKDRLVTE